MTQVENADKPGFFRRLLCKVRPPRELNTAKVPRISADVVITADRANGTQRLNWRSVAQCLSYSGRIGSVPI